MGNKKTGGLWRKHGIEGGKYLVTRRDGSVPVWPSFVIGARDPAASAALLAYADKAQELGYDPEFVSDMRELAAEFATYLLFAGSGDPDAVPHRKDDPLTVGRMKDRY